MAVSDSGEICLSDPQNGTIAIFDSKLRPKERCALFLLSFAGFPGCLLILSLFSLLVMLY